MATINGSNNDDTLSNLSGDNTYFGFGGNDSIVAGDGEDVLYGGAGNDSLFAGGGNDSIDNSEGGNDTLSGGGGDDWLSDSEGDDTHYGGGGNDVIIDYAGIDVIDAGDDDDSVTAYGAGDSITGGSGNDRIQINVTVAEPLVVIGTYDGGAGTDTLALPYLGSDISGATISGFETLETGGNSGGVVTATIAQFEAFDTIIASTADGFAATPVALRLADGGRIDLVDELTGRGATVYASALGNTITTGDSEDVLYGGAGNDALFAGGGNDAIDDSEGGNDTLSGGAGDDWLSDSEGDDTHYGGGGNDVIIDYAGTDVIDAGDDDDSVTAYGAGDSITGGSGNDRIQINVTVAEPLVVTGTYDGGTGTDTLALPYLGSDISGATISGFETLETGGNSGGIVTATIAQFEAFDTIIASTAEGFAATPVALRLADGGTIDLVDELTGRGATVYASALGNTITTGAEDDILIGGDGIDTLFGGLGNDVYVVGEGDTVSEEGGGGEDRIEATGSFTLGAGFENLTLTGTANVNGTGNGQSNEITGNSGANTVDGGGGTDTLIGGGGNDTYVTDGGDTITETSSQGSDTVQSSVAFTLGSNLENLVLTGSGAINGTGNALANRLTGNSGNNTLNGAGGTDTIVGGAGNDTYVTDGGDTISENSGQGTDTVQSSVAFTLGANLENLVLTGNATINGTGNTLANRLTGNTGNNTLNGAGGGDTMLGGSGNDTYVVDGGDTVTENSSQGTDTVQSSVSFTLGANLEKLILTGSGSTAGTGNTLSNTISGNSSANSLNGGSGSDTLTGGSGADNFIFNSTLGASNVDRITDFNVAADTIRLENAIFTGLAGGTLAASAFIRNASGNAADASDRIIYETDTGKLYFDRDGTGGASKVHFATVGTNLAVTNADFFVF